MLSTHFALPVLLAASVIGAAPAIPPGPAAQPTLWAGVPFAPAAQPLVALENTQLPGAPILRRVPSADRCNPAAPPGPGALGSGMPRLDEPEPRAGETAAGKSRGPPRPAL